MLPGQELGGPEPRVAPGPFPRPHRHDTLAAHQGRQHPQGIGQPVPQVRFRRCHRRRRRGRSGGAGQAGRVPQAEGESDSGVLHHAQGRVRGRGPQRHRRDDEAPDGGQEDRRMRPLLRHGDTVGVRGHPRPQDLQPHGAGGYQGPHGDRVRPHGHHPRGEMVRHQQVPRQARPGHLPAQSHEVREVQGIPVLQAFLRGARGAATHTTL